ncbi:hypothetical protein C8R47DRAFT_1047272 [Mycena vitilis]|nr:hypothetical protein C8R47DRAFT_1050420 [Mycena vitilis]KAJ6487206.1 hypothetical protein C8R47DRAFT_1047272 [Mycena vitilis]
MNTLFATPGAGNTVQTGTDTHPILMIDSIHEAEFEAFILVAYGRPMMQNDYPAGAAICPVLVSLLELAHCFQSPPTVTHAVQMIKIRCWDFHPAQLICLSYKHSTRVWYELAFSRLVSMDLRSLNAEQVEWLGFDMYVVVARLKEAMDRQRRILASDPPLFEADPDPKGGSVFDVNRGIPHSRECTNHPGCAQDWYTAWWCGMARFLLDGHCALSYTESIRQFQLMEFGNMNPLCRLKMFDAIRDDEGNGHKYGMLDEATKELMQGITVTPMEDDF